MKTYILGLKEWKKRPYTKSFSGGTEVEFRKDKKGFTAKAAKSYLKKMGLGDFWR